MGDVKGISLEANNSMRKYIALLRGINVGGKNLLPMQDLVAMLQSMGALEIGTYIQSGNVLFTAAIADAEDWCQNLAQKIQAEKGFTPPLLLLSKADFDKAITENPFPVEDGKILHCFFLAQEPARDCLQELVRIKSDSEQIELLDRVLYLYTPDGFGRSKLAARAEKILGVAATARNWNTIVKLAQLGDE